MIFDIINEEPQNTNDAAPVSKSMELARQRLIKDFAAIDLPQNCQLTHEKQPNGENDLMNFTVLLKAEDSSIWEGGIYPFKVTVPENFPIEPPICKLPEPIFHPNIDMDGNVCLNILRKDWAPVITINHIIFGLETLLNDPNPNDPLNRCKLF